jgi:hypothetical protein
MPTSIADPSCSSLAQIWFFPVRTKLLAKKLRLQLQRLPVEDWMELWPLRLWCLYMGAIESEDIDGLHWFAERIAANSWAYGIREWEKVKKRAMECCGLKTFLKA